MNATTQGLPPGPPPPPPPEPRRLVRVREGRVFGGVCSGLGRYFNIDPAIFRIAVLVASFFGGAGFLAYLVAWALVPAEGTDLDAPPARGRWIIVLLVALVFGLPFLAVVAFTVGGILVPVALLAGAGVLVWWIVSGDGPTGTPGEVAKRAFFGIIVIAFCAVFAFGGAWAAAAGGETFVAIAVIAAGVAVLVGAFVRPVRWLILPAVTVALSAGVVAAAGVDLDGGVGDRDYRPTSTADLQERYELGVGELTLDLSRLRFPPGDHTVTVDVGVGQARVIMPDSRVCAGLTGTVGIGEARLYQHSNSGVNVDFRELPDARPATPRVVIDGDVGVGELRVQGNGVGGGPWDNNRRCTAESQRASR